MRYLVLSLILCLPLITQAQGEVIRSDTSGYLPLFVSGALEYNLLLASSLGINSEVERIILLGADIETETSEGVTPLIYAVINNNINTVRILLKYEADVNHPTNRRETPLLIAIKNANTEIAEILIRYGADVNYQGSYGAGPLHYASAYGLYNLADMLLYYDAEADIRTNDDTTPLMAAIWAGYPDLSELLIKYGANMEARDKDGFTPFLIASQNGDTAIMKILREKGVDIYVKNIHNWDALNLTVRSGQKAAVEMLLRTGDKWKDPDRQVIDPYNVAVTYRIKDMISLLDRNDFKPGRKMVLDQMTLSASIKTDFRDFYSGMSISLREPLNSIGIISGFDTKPWYTRVLIRERDDLFYQYYDKSSLVFAGFFKEFWLSDNMIRSNYTLTTSLAAGYSFGNRLKGTLISPGNKFRFIPAVTLKMTKNNYSLSAGVEFTNTDFHRTGPLWLRIGYSYNLFFNNIRAPLKVIKWY